MKQFYRNLLKKSYLIVRRYKFLWFFGVFAAMMGNGREVQMLFRAGEVVPNLPTEFSDWGQFFLEYTPAELIGAFWDLFVLNPSLAFPLFGILLAVIIFMVWLIMLSQGALVHSTARVQSNKAIDFKTVFSTVHDKIWEVFALNIFTRVILYGALALLILPFSGLLMVNDGNAVGLFGITLLSFLIIVPLAMVVNFVLKYALVYAVVDGEKTWSAFQKAWQLFWKYWLVSLEFAIVMFVLNILVVLGMFVGLFFLAVPFMAVGVVLIASGFAGLANLALILALLIFMIIIALVGAGWAVFQYSAWTLLFFELKKGKAYSKLHRIVARG
ncbi:MAG: hypothetical protein ACPGO5_03585 [Patescibacteria group bacterium]